MRNLIAFFLCIYAVYSATAQEKPDFGPMMEIDRGYLPTIVGEDNDELYGIHYEDETIFVETFNKKKLKSKGKKAVEMVELRGVTEELEGLTFLSGEVVFFTSLFNYRDDKFDLIAQTVDPKTGRITDKITLFEKPIDKRRHKGTYDVYLSKNRKRILVRTYTYYKETDQTIENLLLFDDKLELITEREYTEKGNQVNLSSSLVVDDEGSIYFIQNGSVVLLDAFNNFEEWREELPTDNLTVGSSYNQITISLNQDLDPVITAYYVTKDLEDLDRKNVNKSRANRKEDDTQVEGVMFIKINSLDKELEVAKHTEFEKDFIDLFKTKDDLKRNYDAEIENKFSSNRIYSLDNGETLLIGEVVYRIVSRDAQTGAVQGISHFYQDMIMVHFSSEGEVLWKDRLPKMQRYYWGRSLLGYGGSAGYSFLVFPEGVQQYFYEKAIKVGDKVYLTYNDMPENRAGNSYVHELKEFRKFKKGVPVVQTIDLASGSRNGEVVRSLVKPKFWLKPRSMYASKLSDDVFYFITYKKKMHLARTSFK
jgi:hypothetical protein